tara:strand:+ start:152 stop:1060 length:909 start_codon:yes stop_codon:yes gene_type:complete
MIKIWNKFFNKADYKKLKDEDLKKKNIKIYNETIKVNLDNIKKALEKKKEISFLHSGHLGDIINSLPLIKEISSIKECSLFIEKNKLLPNHLQNVKDNKNEYFLTENSINKILPLLSKQPYLKKVQIYNKESIDINLNYFRDLPINFNIDSVRWYFHITGIHGDLENPYLLNINKHKIKDKIVIIRSTRRKNYLIDYKFLQNYNDVLFLGLPDEYEDLKKEIPNLQFYNCKDFLEMAEVINSSKIFIGNLSFGYTIAEGLKKPRLLESGPDFPLVYPNGKNAYDFYFQDHFEKNFKKIYLNK